MLILLICILILCAWLYGSYALVIKRRNKVQEAFASIDVQLKKRYDLIPNILMIAQKFMDHEKSLIEEVVKLRVEATKLSDNFSDIDKKVALDNEIANKMGKLMVAVENYPQLKSDNTMVTAMQTYNEVEEHISAARRFYNSAANELKNAVEIFPSSMFASSLGITSVEFFKAEEAERKSINASDYLK